MSVERAEEAARLRGVVIAANLRLDEIEQERLRELTAAGRGEVMKAESELRREEEEVRARWEAEQEPKDRRVGDFGLDDHLLGTPLERSVAALANRVEGIDGLATRTSLRVDGFLDRQEGLARAVERLERRARQ